MFWLALLLAIDRTHPYYPFSLHKEKILKGLLYPYYAKAKAKYPDKEVWKKMQVDIQRLVKKCGVSGRKRGYAPTDLNMIEWMWDYQKDRVDEYSVKGASQEEVDRAKDYVKSEWEAASGKAKQRSESFKDRLEKCVKADGDNNFRS